MSSVGITEMFRNHAFLKGLSERHLMILASGARPFSGTTGAHLFHEGAPAQAFYLIQSGRVALETRSPKGGETLLQTLGPGEVVGWSWLVPPHRWQFDCRVLDNVQGIVFDGAWLRELCESDHELGYQLLKHLLAVIASRLAATRHRLPEGEVSHK
jgi:CRP/FNR family cyclic AMP-dependent transcriptional regulator